MSHEDPSLSAGRPLDIALGGQDEGEGATLRADAVTLQGLWCPLLSPEPGRPKLCSAQSADVERPRLAQDHGAGRVLCLRSTRITLTGIRFRADALTATLPGGLPLVLSTDAVPPLPVPQITLLGVQAHGVQISASRVATGPTDLQLTGEQHCN
ncbi:hypothetical protein [Streptomyces sp. GS7]|uniref:hypothetical protein n=1 Tax=Streptomyces sp. GS7 TaxID=2692234 RepID=UPI001315F101|nr:hypothetical protein [Streptomyces sp. GS7]QHC21481.1 hypothetical protein GR130_08680 [Streptomyces sp. GS7]